MPGGGSENFWVGVCHWNSETLNLHQTTFSSIVQPYPRLDAGNPYPILDKLSSKNLPSNIAA